MGKTSIDQLAAEHEWFVVHTGPALVKYDDKTRYVCEQLVRRYDGSLCAVCQSRRCDDASSFVIRTQPSESARQYALSPYAICTSCASEHPEAELIALGRARRLVPTRARQERKTPPLPAKGSLLTCPNCGKPTPLFEVPDPPGPGQSNVGILQPCIDCGGYLAIVRGRDGTIEILGCP